MAGMPMIQQMLVSPRIGGGEKLGIEIHRYFTSRWPESTQLLTPAGGDTENFAVAERLAFRTYRLDWLLSRNPLLAVLGCLSVLAKLPRNGVLHIHSPFVYRALRPVLGLTKVTVILHLHLDYSAEDLRWTLWRAPDLVIVCAAFMKSRVTEALESNRTAATPVVPVINAVDTVRFAPGDKPAARRKFDVPAQDAVLLMTANLAPHKGQETAIKALDLLTRQGGSAQLWLVGEERDRDGLYTRRLHELVASLALQSRVKFLGFRNDIPELLHAADYLLLPSTQEGLPLAILEAQASKVVVLAAPTAGIPEIIEHGRTGFLVAADDAAGYATALQNLLNDRGLAERVASSAFEQVTTHYTMPRYCSNVAHAYQQLPGFH